MLAIFSRNIHSYCELKGLQKTVRCYSNVPLPASESVVPLQLTVDNQYERVAQVMTPLWQTPYPQQMKLKFNWSRSIVKKLAATLHKQAKAGKLIRMSCKVHAVRPSPITEGYRNKDEFNIQNGVDGNSKTVGFFVGRGRDNDVVCVRGTHLINMRQSHKEVAQAYEDYIRSSSLPACLHFADGGHWRSLLVRSNDAGEVMAVVVFHPQNMEQDRLEEEGNKLREFFLNGPGARCNLHSLYFQPCRHTRCTADQAPYTLLFGETHLTEMLSGFKFRISPDSFFQVNTAAAAVLYDTIIKVSNVTPMTTLLDICCGTGTVSIFASRHVRGAIGVESVSNAVTDARINIITNEINNVEIIPGLAEKMIPKIIAELGMTSNIVAVVNPGRNGLHSRVIKALCDCPQIRHLVYVSCKADSPNTVSNFVELYKQGNFSLRDVVPVDLFPHTMHTELVMAFNR